MTAGGCIQTAGFFLWQIFEFILVNTTCKLRNCLYLIHFTLAAQIYNQPRLMCTDSGIPMGPVILVYGKVTGTCARTPSGNLKCPLLLSLAAPCYRPGPHSTVPPLIRASYLEPPLPLLRAVSPPYSSKLNWRKGTCCTCLSACCICCPYTGTDNRVNTPNRINPGEQEKGDFLKEFINISQYLF